MQAALLEPDFLLVGEVGGDRRVGNGEVFDVDFADYLADAPEDLFATDGAEAKTHIQQAQYVEIVQALGPFAILPELARGVDAAHHGAHGAAGDTGDLVAARLDFLDYPDMRVTTRAPRSQYQCHAFAHGQFPHLGCVDDTPVTWPAPGRATRLPGPGGRHLPSSPRH
ncbi:hypothetical protein D9M69_612870 [compost metagenome]